ncbi:hypothetical protein [Deinococcus fonticola]|uniref:hypothetical protein n=1 Tax=Deinococcus fonticola TaxID=2528713 RepID=UPI001F0E0C7C|nr:hypothetical protein [Deinococcus fonticola]
MAENPKDQPPQLPPTYLKDISYPTEVRYMTEQEEARARLKASIDALSEQASLQVQMQKEPLKMLGGASAVGAVMGLVLGRQLRRSKKIYVDAESPLKHQKGLMKAQSQQQSGKGMGGALIATLGTLAFKQVMEKVVTPRLEEAANNLLEKAGQPASHAPRPQVSAAPRPVLVPASPAANQPEPVASFLKTPAPAAPQVAPVTAHVGVIPMPESQVEAKAVGTPIAEEERRNPNAH